MSGLQLLDVVWLFLDDGVGLEDGRELGLRSDPKPFLRGSKNQLKDVQVGSKIESGGSEASQAAKNKLLKASGPFQNASGLPSGGLFGSPEPFKTSVDCITNKEPNSKCLLDRFWDGSEAAFGLVFQGFC